jgi:hypothetical protein
MYLFDSPTASSQSDDLRRPVLTGSGLGQPLSPSTNCSAIAGGRYDEQPADLKRVLSTSFAKPAEWLEGLDRDTRMALTSIFNRMCRYGVWSHVRRVVRTTAGEAPFMIADRALQVPGLTPSVYFVSQSGDALINALMATGRFCMAKGAGASLHPGQTTLREISKSDSLHISIGSQRSRDEFDAHIDLYSPVTEHPGSSFCSNSPSVAAVGHIGREVFPEGFRKLTGIPGVQVFPEPAPPPPAPPPPRHEGDIPDIVRMTWRGPRTPIKPRAPRQAGPLLAADVVARINRAVKEQVSPDALLPSHVRLRVARTRKAAETAGPNEEAAARYARDVAEQEAKSYPDAQEFALELAELMEVARRSNVAWVKVVLPQYGSGDFSSRRAIAGQIQRIALVLRNYLPDRAKGVRSIVITFGTGNFATREEAKLP